MRHQIHNNTYSLNYYTPILKAICNSIKKERNIHKIKYLIGKKKLLINMPIGENKNTLLHECSSSDVKIIKLLFKYKANFNLQNLHNQTPIHLILLNTKDLNVIRMIFNHQDKMNLNIQDNKNNTPLHYLAANSNFSSKKFIIILKMFGNVMNNQLSIDNIYGIQPLISDLYIANSDNIIPLMSLISNKNFDSTLLQFLFQLIALYDTQNLFDNAENNVSLIHYVFNPKNNVSSKTLNLFMQDEKFVNHKYTFDQFGYTAIHYLMMHHNLTPGLILHFNKTELLLANEQGMTPVLAFAASNIYNLLLLATIAYHIPQSINSVNNDAESFLSIAFQNSNFYNPFFQKPYCYDKKLILIHILGFDLFYPSDEMYKIPIISFHENILENFNLCIKQLELPHIFKTSIILPEISQINLFLNKYITNWDNCNYMFPIAIKHQLFKFYLILQRFTDQQNSQFFNQNHTVQNFFRDNKIHESIEDRSHKITMLIKILYLTDIEDVDSLNGAIVNNYVMPHMINEDNMNQEIQINMEALLTQGLTNGNWKLLLLNILKEDPSQLNEESIFTQLLEFIPLTILPQDNIDINNVDIEINDIDINNVEINIIINDTDSVEIESTSN